MHTIPKEILFVQESWELLHLAKNVVRSKEHIDEEVFSCGWWNVTNLSGWGLRPSGTAARRLLFSSAFTTLGQHWLCSASGCLPPGLTTHSSRESRTPPAHVCEVRVASCIPGISLPLHRACEPALDSCQKGLRTQPRIRLTQHLVGKLLSNQRWEGVGQIDSFSSFLQQDVPHIYSSSLSRDIPCVQLEASDKQPQCPRVRPRAWGSVSLPWPLLIMPWSIASSVHSCKLCTST